MPRRPPLPDVPVVPLLFAALKLLLHALAITNYGYFRDELYYIACSKHLAWGFVDQPPFSIALLAWNREILGDSLLALRWLPALSGAGTVVMTGLLVRELGGGRFAHTAFLDAAESSRSRKALEEDGESLRSRRVRRR